MSDLNGLVLLSSVLQRLEGAGVSADQIKVISANLPTVRELKGWDKRYAEGGHLWGDSPSICAQHIIDSVDPSSLILDLACGYGRDSLHFVKNGHRVVAIDKSEIAVAEAMSVLGAGGYIDTGNAGVMCFDIVKAPLLQGAFAAVSCHRMFHLPEPSAVPPIARGAYGVLEEGGIIAVTARSPDDFNSSQMNMVDENTAVYKDRPEHFIHFYDEKRLKKALSRYFTDFSFEQHEEIESVGNEIDGHPVMTKLTLAIARKKTASEMKKNGNGASHEALDLSHS